LPKSKLTITPRAAQQLKAIQTANSINESHVLRIDTESEGFSLWLGPEMAGDIVVGSDETILLWASPEVNRLLEKIDVVIDCVDDKEGHPRLIVYPADDMPQS